jgi:hypothetical protein
MPHRKKVPNPDTASDEIPARLRSPFHYAILRKECQAKAEAS